jgi:hypothetical protein
MSSGVTLVFFGKISEKTILKIRVPAITYMDITGEC